MPTKTLAEQLTDEVQHARLRIRRQLLGIDAGAPAERLQAALHVVERGRAGCRLARVLAGGPGQACDAPGDHFLVRARSPARGTSDRTRHAGHGLAVGVDRPETAASGAVTG